MAMVCDPPVAGSQVGTGAAVCRDGEDHPAVAAVRAMSRFRVGVGVVFMLCAMAVVAVLASGTWVSGALSRPMAFRPLVQDALNHVQDVLAVAGAVLLALALVGATKVAAAGSPRAAQVDSWSSHEMTDLGHRRAGPLRRFLPAGFAGGVPAVAAAGVCLAILTTSIGNEVSNGPNRPIVAVLDRVAPGSVLVVGYRG